MNNLNETFQQEAFIKILINAWVGQVTRAGQLFNNLTDEELIKETSPGRNTGVYLLGHLTAVHDAMLPLLGFGEKQYPQLQSLFITAGDKSGQQYPPIHELKKCWEDVNTKLIENFNALSPEDWLTRHTAVSIEDFAKEPHRNKLNVFMSRINHLSYHYGQLIYLKKK